MSSNPQSESEDPLLVATTAPKRDVCQVLYKLWVKAASIFVLLSLSFCFHLAPAPRAQLTSLAPALHNQSLHGLARAAQSLGDNASWHQDSVDFRGAKLFARPGLLCAQGPSSRRLCHDGLTGAWRLHDQNESYTFYFVRGRLINDTEDVPHGCREIHRRDEVAELDAGCEAFCSAVFGPPGGFPIVQQMVASFGSFPDFVKVSTHACSMLWSASLLEPLRSKALQWSLVALYALAGLLLLCFRGTVEEDSGYEWKQESTYDLRKLDLPLCCFKARTDKNRARWQLAIAVPSALLDNPLDVLALTNFAIKGRMFFFLATAFGIAITGYADPFQARAYAAAWSCWQRGFPGRKWLEHQAHEGGHEAPIAGFIALASLAAAPVGAVDLQSLAINTASGLSSLALAVPNGAKAQHLLAKIDDGQTDIENDYVRQEEAKSKVPLGVKFGYSARLFAAVAAAGLFPRLSGACSGYFLGACIILLYMREEVLRRTGFEHQMEVLLSAFNNKMQDLMKVPGLPAVPPPEYSRGIAVMSKVTPPLCIAGSTFAALILWVKEPHGPASYVEELWSTSLGGWQSAEAAAAAVQLSLLILGVPAVVLALWWSFQDCRESFQAMRGEQEAQRAQANLAAET